MGVISKYLKARLEHDVPDTGAGQPLRLIAWKDVERMTWPIVALRSFIQDSAWIDTVQNKTIFGYKFGLFYAVLSFPQSGRIATSVRFFCVVVSMFCGSTGSKEKSGSRLSWRRTWQSLVSVLQRNTQILENLNNSEWFYHYQCRFLKNPAVLLQRSWSSSTRSSNSDNPTQLYPAYIWVYQI